MPAPPWSRAVERAVRADDPAQLRALLADGESPEGHDMAGTSLTALANEHSSACYRVLRALRSLADARYPTYVPPAGQVLVRANPNHKIGLLLAMLRHGEIVPQINLTLRYASGWGQWPLGDADFGKFVPLLCFFLPWQVVRALDDRLSDATPEAVCARVQTDASLPGAAPDVPKRQGTLALLSVYASGQNVTMEVSRGLLAVLDGATECDERGLALLGVALDAMDAALQCAAVPLAERVVCAMTAGGEKDCRTAAWHSAFTWTACRLPAAGGADLRVELEQGTRVVPVAALLPRAEYPMDAEDVAYLVAPGQIVTELAGGDGIRVHPAAGGPGFVITDTGHERVARRACPRELALR